MTAVLDELRRLEQLAAADAAGDAKAHGELLKGIGTLLLAAETPLDTTSRLNFQVRLMQPRPTSAMGVCILMRCLQPAAPPKHLHSNRD